MTYQIPPHLRSCDVGGKTVFLDLASNRYRGLAGTTDTAFRAAISGECLDERLVPIVDRLCQEGLLDRNSAAPAAELLPAPIDAYVVKAGRANIARVAEAVWAAILASQFKRMSLIDVGRHLACERIRGERRAKAKTAGVDEILSAHIAVGAIVPSHDRCLDRSISLAWVCASHGHRAELVIGVSVPPFNAHAWVQSGTTVLNDTVECVRQYQPIHQI